MIRKASRLSWSWSLPVPWGVEFEHDLGTIDLLRLPLSFTQSRLLDPSDFINEASARGVRLSVEHLTELHRRRILVPFFQVLRHPRRTHSSAGADGIPEVTYRRGAFDDVLEAAHLGCLLDPGSERFIPWRNRNDRRWRGPPVYYSEHQLLGVEALEPAVAAMKGSWSDEHKLTVSLRPPRPEVVEEMHRGRALAILLTALDAHYLPNILGVVSWPDEWFKLDPKFDLDQRLRPFTVMPETIAKTAESLIFRAHSIDPLGDWFKLVGLAHPASWKQLKKEARLAMDFRVAAEVLLRALDDLGREDLSKPPEQTGRMAWVILDDRLPGDASGLDRQLMSRGLSPHPSLLLALEGKTEMMLMPRVMAEVYEAPVPDRLVECVFMDTVNRDLDLLVRHSLATRFGRAYEDFVILERPPTQILVAVDPEKSYSTEVKQEAERQKLARRLFETLPASVQSPQAREDIDTLVTVTTWGRSWEFANFTDLELAKAIMRIVPLPDHVTIDEVRARVAGMRAATLAANIEHATKPWGVGVNKVKLADALWPVLRTKLRRRLKSGTIDSLPAGRVAKTALELAMRTHRRSVGLRTGG